MSEVFFSPRRFSDFSLFCTSLSPQNVDYKRFRYLVETTDGKIRRHLNFLKNFSLYSRYNIFSPSLFCAQFLFFLFPCYFFISLVSRAECLVKSNLFHHSCWSLSWAGLFRDISGNFLSLSLSTSHNILNLMRQCVVGVCRNLPIFLYFIAYRR